MRKIQNNSLVRFFYGNLENIVKDPFPDPLKVRPGDLLRFLINKYEVGSENYSELKVCLLPIEKPNVTSFFSRTPVMDIGTIRPQLSETFTHFKIKLGSFQKDTYKQFTLTAENPIFTPFSYEGDSEAELMQNLSDHINEIPFCITRTKINGPILDVYFIHSTTMVLAVDLTVELGHVNTLNSNAPGLYGTFIESYVRGASKDYKFNVTGTIVPGNQFIFDSQTFVAKKGTTGMDIINFFIPDKTGIVNIPDAEAFSLEFLPGSQTKINSNFPAITATKDSTSGGNDKYLIKLFGTYQVGNVLSVYTAARSITHIVAPGDSIGSMEAILNPDAGGFFTVPTTVLVSVSGKPGQSAVANDNFVSFSSEILAIHPVADIDKYGVSIGSDVVKGNKFKIIDEDNDVEIIVTATSLDNNSSIGEKLSGLANPYFIYERVQQAGPILFQALSGNKYTEEDLMDITVVSQPNIAKPDQVICEIIAPEVGALPELLPKGRYILAIRDALGIKSIATTFDFDEHEYTSLIEAADRNNVFGVDYSEGGLTQRIRAEIALQTEVSSINESVGTNLDGVEESINTRIDFKAPFSSQPIGLSLAKSLLILLKNNFVRINETVLRISDVSYGVLNEFGQKCELVGTGDMINDYIDNHDRMMYPRVLNGSNAIISAEYAFGLRLFLRNDNFTREIIAETQIPANGYYLETISDIPGKGFIRILIRDQKDVLVEMEVDKELKHRSIPFRIQPGSKVIIELTEVAEINNTGFYPVEIAEVEIEYVPEETESEGSGFDDESFDDEFFD